MPAAGKVVARVKNRLAYLYFRYNLETHLYMCEPWERTFVNSVLLLLLTLLLLISYFYVLPAANYLKNALLVPVSRVQWWQQIAATRMQAADDM